MKRMMKLGVLMVVLLGLLANVGFAAETKTIVFLYSDMVGSIKKEMLKGLEQAGLVDQQNVTILQVNVSSDSDPMQIVAQVQEAAPDVILNAAEYRPILDALHGLSIPVIARNAS